MDFLFAIAAGEDLKGSAAGGSREQLRLREEPEGPVMGTGRESADWLTKPREKAVPIQRGR